MAEYTLCVRVGQCESNNAWGGHGLYSVPQVHSKHSASSPSSPPPTTHWVTVEQSETDNSCGWLHTVLQVHSKYSASSSSYSLTSSDIITTITPPPTTQWLRVEESLVDNTCSGLHHELQVHSKYSASSYIHCYHHHHHHSTTSHTLTKGWTERDRTTFVLDFIVSYKSTANTQLCHHHNLHQPHTEWGLDRAWDRHHLWWILHCATSPQQTLSFIIITTTNHMLTEGWTEWERQHLCWTS